MSFHQENLVWFIKKGLIYTLLLMPCRAYSQGINNFWLMGYASWSTPYFGGSDVDFRNDFPDTLNHQRKMSFLDCNANISDSLGNLLFYTNGIFISNANDDTMSNGSGLNPAPYTSNAVYGLRVKQGNLILPLPADSHQYYLFHETLFYDTLVHDYRVSEIYYSVIDMSLSGGLGAVIQKNIVLLSDTLTPGAITACKHANGRDWWMVFHKSKGRRYYKFLLTPSGLQGPFAQDIGYSIAPNDWIWQSCFSPDGSKFVSVMARDTFDVMDFDRCAGLFSNSISVYLPDSQGARGTAISPNSQMLYISSTNFLYQYNLSASSLDSSKTLLDRFDGYSDPTQLGLTFYYLAQLANDGKIYINTGNTTRLMSVINNPNSLGIACNLHQHGLVLPSINGFTIPNFPNYFLAEEPGSVCDSLFPRTNTNYSPAQSRMQEINFIPSLVSDERGEAIKTKLVDFNERDTYFYFLKQTTPRISKVTK